MRNTKTLRNQFNELNIGMAWFGDGNPQYYLLQRNSTIDNVILEAMKTRWIKSDQNRESMLNNKEKFYHLVNKWTHWVHLQLS